MDGRRSSSSGGWVKTSGTKLPVEESEQKRNSSEETRSHIQEVITGEDVLEWIPGAPAVDVEWVLRCHGCSGPERTYKYFQLISVSQEVVSPDGRSHSEQDHQQQRSTRSMLEISRGVQGIIFEVITTLQRERARANELLGKAADAVVRGEMWPTDDAKGQSRIRAAEIAGSHPSCKQRVHQEGDQGGAGRRLDDAGDRQKTHRLGGSKLEEVC